jgi:predicted esterase
MRRIVEALLACALVVLLSNSAPSAEPGKGYTKKVSVQGPTRIDWTFVFSSKSVARPPADWLGDYDSKQQQYDLYVPANVKTAGKGEGTPLILFISAGAGPSGWPNFEDACKERGMLFASPYNAGNGVDTKKRVRIVLDVLDDVRRRYRVDPDRTYIAGFSGGARIACGIACALPEYFGGLITCCAVNDLRREVRDGDKSVSEYALVHRLTDRLSIALITGETDFNRPEAERLYGPIFINTDVRCRVWVVPKMGHGIPGGKELKEVVAWVEEDLKRRQELAKKYPASRADDDKAFTRENWSKAVLAEGKERMKDPEMQYRGLMLLKGCMQRWDDLPAGTEAKKILLQYDAREDRPWELKEVNEQRRLILAQARAFHDYAAGPLPKQYEKDRVDYAKEALLRWKFIKKDGAGTKAADEADKRIPALQKIIDGK